MDYIEFYKGPFMPTTSHNFKKVTKYHKVLNTCNRLSNSLTRGIGMSNNGKQNELAISKLDKDNENRGLSIDSSLLALDQCSTLGI